MIWILYAALVAEKDELERRIANLLAECDTKGWISTCEVRELLEVGCDRAACAEPRPHEHMVHVDVSDWDCAEDAAYDKENTDG